MSRPAAPVTRPAARRGAVSALLGVAAAAGLVALPALPVVQAVVSYDGALRPVPGVTVVHDLPALGAAVVRTDAAGLARLASTGQVRGIAADEALHVTSGQDTSGAGGVLASAGLGGAAGQPGAGAGVRVAVIDTGVSDTAALNRASGRLVDAVDTSTGTARTGGTYTDSFGHGTFMADVVAGGPVAATDGQAVGVAPAATVLVVRVAGADGTTSLSKVLLGLQWVAQHPGAVDVANLSLSRQRPMPRYGSDPLTDAVDAVREAGVAVVVSAGNTPGQVGDPGFDPGAVTVGALDSATGRVASFSGSAVVAGIRKPDVVASGVHVLGLLPEGSVLATRPTTVRLANGLYRGTGTSQATAITSGLAALVVAAHPDATPVQVKAALRCAATDLPGKRDGAGAVRATSTLCTAPDGTSLDGSSDPSGELGFDASSWAASSWAASSWAASSWAASSWAGDSFPASSWAASSWAASSWAASSWAASSWAASSWAASSWAASSWAASSWAASSWAASSWAASSWAASSWAAGDWGSGSSGGGDPS